jgi:transposase
MAFIMERKYVLAVPLYRQEQQFKHYGIELSRQTLANWMIRGATDWLSLLYERMKEHLIQHDILHADELCKASHNSSYVESYIMSSYEWSCLSNKDIPA